MTGEGDYGPTTCPVLAALPHRAPFLLVDRVVACEAGRWVRATRLLTAGDPLLPGGGAGALPAPLLIEAVAQAAAALLLSARPDAVPALLGVDHAAFPGECALPPVRAHAGDTLHLYAEVRWLRRRVGRARGAATLGAADGPVLCDALFTFGLL